MTAPTVRHKYLVAEFERKLELRLDHGDRD
jgi:hypothetical protein